jgi:hypothetical protein
MTNTRERAIGDAIYTFGVTDGPWDERLRAAITAYDKTLCGGVMADAEIDLLIAMADVVATLARDVGKHVDADGIYELQARLARAAGLP